MEVLSYFCGSGGEESRTPVLHTSLSMFYTAFVPILI